jgi:hypothetical protein
MKTLGAHPLGQSPGICRESSDANGNVRINADNFLLIGRKFGHGTLERSNDSMSGGAETDASGSLLDGFHGVFDLKKATLRTPYCYIGIVLVSKHDKALAALFLKRYPTGEWNGMGLSEMGYYCRERKVLLTNTRSID